MELIYIANELTEDTLGVFNRIHSQYPSVKIISDDKGTNYDEYVSSNNDNNRYFVLVNCVHKAPATESFKDLCALGAAGMLHHAKYVLFYHSETSMDSFLQNIHDYMYETVPEG
jgi:hypothetical protein